MTALAAGHRPCFECRRKDAQEFAARWQVAFKLGAAPFAPEMDKVLHGERLDGHAKRLSQRGLNDLPDGAMIVLGEEAFAVRGDGLLRWTPDGYGTRKPRPYGITVDVLTPPSTVAVLKAGYRPRWHRSAVTLSPRRGVGWGEGERK